MGRRSNQRLDENAIHLTLFAHSGMQISIPVKISLAYISGKDQYASSGRIFAFYHHTSSSAGRLGSALLPCHSPGLRRHSQSRRLTCSSLFLVLSFSSLWLSWPVWDYFQPGVLLCTRTLLQGAFILCHRSCTKTGWFQTADSDLIAILYTFKEVVFPRGVCAFFWIHPSY